jgi:selenocysteine-specific elongation factor
VTAAPLVLGTAGHIDHGKTTLVRALTGVDTDRLPAERERGMTIELGYAPLVLPSGRRLGVVDVPGHERFVRTMVAGASGIDLFCMVVAADDGVMPQTREHAAVLAALGVAHGVVAITKADLADPARAVAEARALLPGVPVAVGADAVPAALDAVAAALPGRGAGGEDGDAVLHVDRVFTIRGAGTVVTGTLWAGAIGRGDRVRVLPSGQEARVRAVQVHDAAVERAVAGQRVALNLPGAVVARGDAVATGPLAPTRVLDAALDLEDAEHAMRVHVHHGTREAPGRLTALGGRFWQLRLERPLLARAGDRLVVRAESAAGGGHPTLGGGVVLDPAARRHGPTRADLARLARLARGEPEPETQGTVPTVPGETEGTVPSVPPAVLDPGALALEERLRAAGPEPPSAAELGDAAAHLPALRAAGRAVRVGRDLHAHPDAVAAVRARVERVVAEEGAITLARLRDELGTSRRYAQALLEHLDAARVTRRLPDDRRVLRAPRATSAAPPR